MGITIQHVASRPDIFGPVVVCDHCGRRIHKASEGIYCYGVHGISLTGLWFFHKSAEEHPACRKEWERRQQVWERDGRIHLWDNLSRFTIALANNLATEPKRPDE